MILKKIVRIIWESGKAWLITTAMLLLFLGIEPVISVWITNRLISEIPAIHLGISEKLVIFLLIVQLVLTVTKNCINSYQIFLDQKYQIRLERYLDEKIFKQISNVAYSRFDDVNYQNHIDRVEINKGNKFMAPVQSVFNFARASVTFVTLFIFLFSMNKWILLIFMSFIPLVGINMWLGSKQFQLHIYQSPTARMMSYLHNLMIDRNAQKELRAYEVNSYFVSVWKKSYDQVNNQIIKLNKRTLLLNSLVFLIEGLIFFVISYSSIRLIILGRLTLADFVSLTQSVILLSATLETMSNAVSTIYEESFFLKDIISLLDIDTKSDRNEKKLSINPSEVESLKVGDPLIEFCNVSFDYPYSDQSVLKNVSFTLRKGKKYFLVGLNGAGKTTLLKCLLGLYKVDSGTIYICGKDISKVSQTSLYKLFSVIFQDYIKYNLTIKSNIILNENFSRKRFTYTLKSFNLEKLISGFNKGSETYLGKMFFVGEDLSGGQWQKISLARLLYKNNPIMILDEPTSALDTETENDVYELIRNTNLGRTVLVTSHRFALTKSVDEIIVLEDGAIVGIGNHEELMDSTEQYRRQYKKQADWYQDNLEELV